MRSTGWVGFAAIALVVGCNLLKKEDADAGATASAAASPADGLPPDCESFLTRYACFLKKQGKPTTEADDMRREWTTSVANPTVRPTIIDVCKKQLATQGPAFDKAGCKANTAVAAATPNTAAPVAKAATATTSTSTAATVDASAPSGPKPTTCKADADCGKGPRDRCVRWGLKGSPMCVTMCSEPTDTCPTAGEVCEPTGRLADYSGIVGFCAKAPHNIAFGGACNTSLDCVAGEKCIKAKDGARCRHLCSGNCRANNEECTTGDDEGIELPDEGSEGKSYCVLKKGFSGAVTTCPAGQEWHDDLKICGARCSDKKEYGKACPAGLTCKMTSKLSGVCIKP